jgi:septum formation protein
MTDILLASQSPRRRELLHRMGLSRFRVLAPEIDEGMDRALPPAELVRRISAEKALAAQAQADHPDIVIAADTVVALDDLVLGKPADEADAGRMLSALSGRRHQVYTGLTVLRGDARFTLAECTHVTFRPLSDREIAAYIATGEPMDKAGAYGLQGYGALFVEKIEGDYYNVMGLPVCRLGQVLGQLGISCMELAAGTQNQKERTQE